MPQEEGEKRLYEKPEIKHELELETRAGSPIDSSPNDADPLALPGS